MSKEHPKEHPITLKYETQYAASLRTGIATGALLCVLLELRVGGILEGLQLESVEHSHAAPNVGGMVVQLRRSDGVQFMIDTSSALTYWPGDKWNLEWQYQTEASAVQATLRNELARMVTRFPLRRAVPLTPLETSEP